MESTTFEIDGESYEVAYNLKRIEMYENNHDAMMSTLNAALQGTGGFKISDVIDLVGYGLRKEGGAFVNPTKGREIATQLLETNGFFPLLNVIIEALQRDCAFLFQMNVDKS